MYVIISNYKYVFKIICQFSFDTFIYQLYHWIYYTKRLKVETIYIDINMSR